MSDPAVRNLRRSSRDRVIAGVCGGVAEYLSTSSTLVRVIWLAAAFWKGIGVLAYLVAVLLIARDYVPQPSGVKRRNSKVTFGVILVIFGLVILLKNQFLMPWGWWPDSSVWLPLLLIIAGFLLLLKGKAGALDIKLEEEPAVDDFAPITPEKRRLCRSRRERIVLGICGGIGKYYGIDPVLVRVAWVAGIVLTEGAGLVLYLLMYLVIPLNTTEIETAAPERESGGS